MEAKICKTIEVTRPGFPVVVDAVQADTGRVVAFVLADMVAPDNTVGAIYAKLKDDGLVYNACTVATTDGVTTVTVELTATMLANEGRWPCQIRLQNGDDVITSFVFTLRVGERIIDDSAIEGNQEFTALEELVAKASQQQASFEAQLAQQQTDFNTQISQQQTSFSAQLTQQQTTFNGKIADYDGQVAEAVAALELVTIAVPASGWASATAGGYQNVVSVADVTAESALFGIQLASAYVDNAAALAAAQSWTYCETDAGTVTFYAPSAPTADFAITAEVR